MLQHSVMEASPPLRPSLNMCVLPGDEEEGEGFLRRTGGRREHRLLQQASALKWK